MARLKLRNHRSQAPLTKDGAAPDGTSPQAASAGGRWPGAEPAAAGTQPVPASGQPADPSSQSAGSLGQSAGPSVRPEAASAEPVAGAGQPAVVADADSADAPFWERWVRVAEPSGLDDHGDGMPDDGPADDAVTDVDPRPAPSRQPVITPVGDARGQPSANGTGAGGARTEGIGEHLGNLAHLSHNPRMRTWQRRAIIAVIVGLIAGILLHNWRWGLTLAVLAAIADTIYRSRTSFTGPAGVRLTRAQKRTARQLSSLERRGYRAMHCLPIPDSNEQIDHLVIGPAGVFAIDSEDWDRRLPVRTSSHRQLWHGPHDMRDRLAHAQWEADQAARLLSNEVGSGIAVRPAMAVYGPKIAWDVATIRDVDVFSGPRLRKYLHRRVRRRDLRLSTAEIERIEKAAHVAFPASRPGAPPVS
jgi:hypothetical protein